MSVACVLFPLLARAAGSLQGVVVSGGARAPLAGVRLVLEPAPAAAGEAPGSLGGTPATRLEAVSDEHGKYAFPQIPPGAYSLLCDHEGFLPFKDETIAIGDQPHGHVVVRLWPVEAMSEEPDSPLGRIRRLREEAASVQAEGSEEISTPNTLPLPDRWRLGPGGTPFALLGLPPWERYPASRKVKDNLYRKGRLLNPYEQNPLKGDLPVIGQHIFMNLTVVLDTFVEARKLPTPSGQSSAGPDSAEFFKDNRQKAGNQNLLLSFELFRGNAGFRPVDWRLKFVPVLNFNYLAVRERGVVNINVARGTDRTDEHIGPQEAFVEVKLADIGPRYDFLSLRVGVQDFLSDFKGFVFLDNQPGVRLFGTLAANRLQWNLAGFELLEKDTNSGLNTTHRRHQRVAVANVFLQDAPVLGYTIQASFHLSHDTAGSDDARGELGSADLPLHFDENGFLVRPAAIGDFKPHDLRVRYVGLTGDGHFGALNITNAFYIVRGHEDHNLISRRRVSVRGEMGALEVSLDRDWLRYRASMFYASGDDDPVDRIAKGFDSILDNPNFAGGAFSFYNRQGLRLTGSNVGLKGRFSLLPDLRSSKDEGQANFVNPGIFLYNVGLDADVTQKFRIVTNFNYMRFDSTRVLEFVLFQDGIRRELGYDLSVGLIYRPKLIDNIILTSGLAYFRPSHGFRDIFEEGRLYSAFSALTLTY